MPKIHLMTALAAASVVLPTVADAKQPPQPQPAETAIAPDRRICVVQPAITGSYLPTKVCKTAADWRKDGVDPVRLIAGKD